MVVQRIYIPSRQINGLYWFESSTEDLILYGLPCGSGNYGKLHVCFLDVVNADAGIGWNPI